MTENYLHGVEVVELDSGVRPIRTVRSSVIGLIGTAPDAKAATTARAVIGQVAAKNALQITAKTAGVAGNAISLMITKPDQAGQDLSVTVVDKTITISLATGGDEAVTTTATQLQTALKRASTPQAELITVDKVNGSDGSGKVSTTIKRVNLIGGSDEPFPLNTPVLVTNRREAGRLGMSGTLPTAHDAIYDQAGAWVVVVRVAPKGVAGAQTKDNVIGGVQADGSYTGVQAFLGSEQAVHVTPRILIAPGYSNDQAVVAEMLGIADKLRAVIVADGPNTTDEAAIDYRKNYGSGRVYVVDPQVKVWDTKTSTTIDQAASPRVAGIIAKSDNERGFWHSPSNREIYGITGTSRPVDFALGDKTSRANYLNENDVATIIHEKGYRLWGNRTCSSDPKWAFLSVRRTADMINESLLRAHLWAVDRNITKQYLEEVSEGVNAYLRDLVTKGAILGGKCWPNDELNTPHNITQGKVYFDFDFTPPYPAEHITFRSALTNDYLTELTAQSAA